MPATSGATAARLDVRQDKGIQTDCFKKSQGEGPKAWPCQQMVESRREVQAHCMAPGECHNRSVPTPSAGKGVSPLALYVQTSRRDWQGAGGVGEWRRGSPQNLSS
jgi:hypothetical protein